MHIHILGICGTFMGGIAAIARQAGHKVTGCDANVYPPMSSQLEAQGIALIEGFAADQLSLKPDLFVIGNVISRGNPLMEAILAANLPFQSGPQWLGEQILQKHHVFSVAGTHGKTTTTAMLTWILEANGRSPSYLIGGVPHNFEVSARIGSSGERQPLFVTEADEYDTAFFDKRSKFVHYRSQTAILNNLEFDHADIFSDIQAIQTQFHHLVRTVPSNGRLIVNSEESTLAQVIAKGVWTPIEYFGQRGVDRVWSFETIDHDDLIVIHRGIPVAQVHWNPQAHIAGRHNQMNALAAIAAAHHVGISPEQSAQALSQFRNVKRRLELIGTVRGISVFDDFAHHPTAIATTIDGLRRRIGKQRLLAVLEPRSNTMKLGVMKQQLAASLVQADLVFGFGVVEGAGALGWDLKESLLPLGDKAQTFDQLDALVQAIQQHAQTGDQILVMSNGSFQGVHQKILNALASTL